MVDRRAPGADRVIVASVETGIEEQLRGHQNRLATDDYEVVRRGAAGRADVSPVLYSFGVFGTAVRSDVVSYPTRVTATLDNYEAIGRS